ncbi:MAG: hypothetical protein NTZ30_13195 [Planctomycetota bacterium]|nr:hypothetical protein [Planctomycetota bacterium]
MNHKVIFSSVAFILCFVNMGALAFPFVEIPLSEQLVFRIEAGGWGDASPEDIRRVLESTGRELLKHIPQNKIIRIHVVASDTVPQVDFKRAANGEFTVRLAVKGRFWAQLAFQFGHELGHIVSHYERINDNKIGNENKWFEETVGEAASLFVLARMADTWKTDPPYMNWKSFAPALKEYLDKLLKDTEIPVVEKMPQWFNDNRPALKADPHLRERNRVVAIHIFKMLERDPSQWEAFRYLNLGRPDATNSFESFLENWYFSAPKKNKGVVKEVVDLLGIKSKLISDHAK